MKIGFIRHCAASLLSATLVMSALAGASTITADASKFGPEMSRDQLGINLLALFQSSGDATYIPLLASAGVGLVRWPGGGTADAYHWQTNSYGPCVGYLAWPETGFDAWMKGFARQLATHVAITVNYGSNSSCTGPGDPVEAAAWVNYANNVQRYDIKYWTVGNEQYFHEIDVDTPPFDPTRYAERVATQFYPLMKMQDPTISVGIDMALGNATHDPNADSWDSIVLARAKYDFVEMHYYPDYNNQDDDARLLTASVDQLATDFATARSLLTMYGHPDAPIFLGEFDRDSGVPAGYGGPGHESVSVANALFNAMVVAEVVKAGIQMSAAWLGIDTCELEALSPPASTAYGWQNFGSFGLFANTGANSPYSCSDKGIRAGTPFPKARAFQILKNYVLPGEHPIAVTNSNPAVRAYAATHRGGYAFLLVNVDPSTTQSVSISVANTSQSLFVAGATTYGKTQYDESKNGVWAAPVSSELGTVATDFSVSLPPWSLTLITLDTFTNYEGLWWASPAGTESGWGINLAHQGDVIFATWFTYDTSGKAWWLSMTASRNADGSYMGTLYQTHGPAFNAVPFNPAAVTATSVGSGTLIFSDGNNGTFAYTVNGVTQTKAITREVFGPLPTCTFGAQPNLALATNYQDLWWAAPAAFESGWGINLTQEGSIIFGTWFTYDLDGTPLWLSVIANNAAPGVFMGALYRTTGPAFNAVPFKPANIKATAVGTATLTFADGNDATFAYTVNGVSQSKAITREVFRAPGTVCQ